MTEQYVQYVEKVSESGTCVFLFESVRFQRSRLEKGEEGGQKREDTLLWKRPFQFSAGTSAACQRVVHVAAFYPRTPWNVYRFSPTRPLPAPSPRALSRKHLRTWPVCRAAFYLERKRKKGKKKKKNFRSPWCVVAWLSRSIIRVLASSGRIGGKSGCRVELVSFEGPQCRFQTAPPQCRRLMYFPRDGNSLLPRRSFDSDPNLT